MVNEVARPGAARRGSVGDRLRRFVKTPKGCALGALVLLTLLGGTAPLGVRGIEQAAVAAAAALLFDAGVARALKRRVPFSVGGLITGLIVADVLSPLTPLWVVVAATLAALLSKHLLRRGRKPIFNPAAIGLLVSLGAFATAQSWWAAMPLMPVWTLGVLLVAGTYVAVRVQKYAQVLMFLGTYFVLVMVMAAMHLGTAAATPADALRSPFINSALFLAFFMMTDPPTSPARTEGQLQYAAIAAAASVATYAAFGGLAYLLVGVLVANLWTLRLALLAPRPALRPGGRHARPAWIVAGASAFVVGAAVAMALGSGGLGLTSQASGTRSSGPRTSATPPRLPATQSGQWTGTVSRTFGEGEGGSGLSLSGTWQGDTLTLVLQGFNNGGQFVIRSGLVTLQGADGSWRGALSGGSGGTLQAVLNPLIGSGARLTITIDAPSFTGQNQFVANVTASAASGGS